MPDSNVTHIAERPAIRQGAGSLRLLLAIVVLLCLTAILRAPFAHDISDDEAFYLVVGRQWLHGSLPYVGAFDVKPPGLFAVTALFEALFGAKPVVAKLLEIVAVATTGFGVWLIGNRFISPNAGIIAALFCLVADLTLDGITETAPLASTAFVALGMALALPVAVDRVPQPAPRCAAAGALFGTAASIYPPAIFAALGLGVAWLRLRGWNAGWRSIGALAVGAALVPLLFVLVYVASGHLDALLEAAVVAAAGRLSGDNVSWSDTALRAVPMLRPILPLAVMGFAGWTERRVAPGDARGPVLRILGYWAAAAWLGALAQHAMYPHYYLPLLPPLCLLSAACLAFVLGRIEPVWLRQCSRLLGIALAFAWLAWTAVASLTPNHTPVEAITNAAALMKAAGLQPDDRILVVNRGLALYLAVDAEPPSAIFHWQHLVCDFPYPPAATALATALDQEPAFVVLANPSLRMVCEREDRRALLRARLARDYCALGEIPSASGGVPDELTIYGLRRRFGARCTPQAGG